MKKFGYTSLRKREEAAKLLKEINEKTNYALNKFQLEAIVNNKFTSMYHEIRVITDAKEFAKEITLTDYKSEHSWAGESYTIEKATTIFGMCKYGRDYQYEYSDNGNITTDKEWVKLPNFDIRDCICIAKTCYEYSDYNNNYYDSQHSCICIYLGSVNAYTIDSELENILNTYNI